MKRYRFHFGLVAVAAASILAASLPARAQEVEWRETKQGWEATMTVQNEVKDLKQLRVERFCGDLTFVTDLKSSPEIVILFKSHEKNRKKAEEDFGLLQPSIRIQDQRGEVECSNRGKWRFNLKHSLALTAVLPQSCTIRAGTSGGDVLVDGFKANVDISTSGGDMTVRNTEGMIDLSTSGGDIQIENSGGEVSAATSGGDIDLRIVKGEYQVATSGGRISVTKAECAHLEASTSGGDVLVRELVGDSFQLATSGGDVQVTKTEVKKRAELSTSGGDIQIDECSGEFEMATHGGDLIAMNHSGSLTMTTSAGDIQAKNLQGLINARTGSGNIQVTLVSAQTDKSRGIVLNTGSGDIQLDLPSRLDAFIEATVASAFKNDKSIQSDFPLQYEDRGRTGTHASGTLNMGGIPIELLSANGVIRIRRR